MLSSATVPSRRRVVGARLELDALLVDRDLTPAGTQGRSRVRPPPRPVPPGRGPTPPAARGAGRERGEQIRRYPHSSGADYGAPVQPSGRSPVRTRFARDCYRVAIGGRRGMARGPSGVRSRPNPAGTVPSMAGTSSNGSYIVAGARTPIGKMSGALASLTAVDLGAHAIAAAPRTGRRGARRGRPRDHGPGAHGRPGPGAVAPGRREGRHPQVGPRRQRQQGVPVGPQHDLPRQPDDRRRRRRHRGGRRHGVDDQRAVPRRRRPGRLPLRQHRAARRDHRRRPVVRVRRLPDGPRHRAVHGGIDQPRGAGRVRRPVARAGRRRDQGRPPGRRDRAGVDPAAPSQRRARRARRHRARRGRPARHDGREPRRAAPGVRQGRRDHRRQRQPALRRRQRRDRDVAGRGRALGASTPLGEFVSYGMVAGPDSVSLLQQPSNAIDASAGPGRPRPSATSTSSRSTRRSPPSASRRAASSASRPTSSTSTVAPSPSATRSA